MMNQNVEATIRKSTAKIIPYEEHRMLMNEVRVYDGNGKLKKIIPPDQLMKRLYKMDGISTAPFPSNPTAQQTKYGKGNCAYCKKEYDKAHSTQRFCKKESGQAHIRDACARAYTAQKLLVPKVKKICRGCNKEFLGPKSRVFCNDPCYNPAHKKEIEIFKPKPCRLCEKIFTPKNNRHVFCQDPCDFELHRNKIRQDRRNALDAKKEVLKSDNDSKHTTTQSDEVQIINSQ